MALNQDEFNTLVQNLETFAKKQPVRYKLRVGLLALLGYGYVILILMGTLALLISIIWLAFNSTSKSFHAIASQLIVSLATLTLILLPALWVSFPPPAGLTLQRKDVPYLFDFVDELALKLQSPRFHQILLTEDFNAAVIQRPRLGLLGWQQNYLIVGLPLMLAFSPEQFCAILAHEFGHLSGNHGRFGGWIYRLRVTWHQIFERLQKTRNQLTWFIFVRFFQWYSPFFDAYSFTLARMNEYEADRCAAEIAGVQNLVNTLIDVEIKSKFLDRYFWSNVLKRVEKEIEPPKTTFAEMQVAFMEEMPTRYVKDILAESLAEITQNYNTHPCLTDRLKALGYLSVVEELYWPKIVQFTAANKFLGNNLGYFINYFNEDWQVRMSTPWRQRYQQIQESLIKLKDLDIKAEKQILTTNEAWERVQLTFELNGEETVIPLLQEIINTDNYHSSANYLLGQILLKQQDAVGIEYIEKAMQTDIHIVIKGCQIIYHFLSKQGKSEAAKSYQKRAQEHYDFLLQVEKERKNLRLYDSFKPHTLPPVDIKSLCQQLSNYPEVKTAYLVEKVVKYLPEKRCFVLGIIWKLNFWEFDTGSKESLLLKNLLQGIKLSDTFIILLNKNHSFKRKISKVPDALIYCHHGKTR